jgi:hypothetical protein
MFATTVSSDLIPLSTDNETNTFSGRYRRVNDYVACRDSIEKKLNKRKTMTVSTGGQQFNHGWTACVMSRSNASISF